MRIPNWHKLWWKEQSDRKDTIMVFWWRWCGACKSVYLECPACGNNSCNAGYGYIDGVPCEICYLADAYEALAMKTGQYPKTKEECDEYNNRMLDFYNIDKDGNVVGLDRPKYKDNEF